MPVKVIAVILIALGVVALIYQGITYTTREDIVKIGPIEASAETEKTIPIPPILGVVAIGAGVVLLVVRRRSLS
jgi:hypothetical protein